MSCTAWGLSCLLHCCRSGGLLPRLFTLARLPFQIRDLRLPKGGFLFCDTFRCPGFRQRPPRLAPGMLPCGVRTFLSSADLAAPTSDHSGRPAASIGAPLSKQNSISGMCDSFGVPRDRKRTLQKKAPRRQSPSDKRVTSISHHAPGSAPHQRPAWSTRRADQGSTKTFSRGCPG